jgi:ribose-phosphate pyrophosphokinase
MMMRDGLLLFAPAASAGLGGRIAEALGTTLAPLEEREFEDGEHKARPLVSVRDRDVFILQSLAGDAERGVDAKLCRLLFLIGTLKDAGAARVTALVPYLAYARKDRRTQSRDPVTTRYVAAFFEAVSTDRLVALEVHNLAAFQNAFRCCTEHLDASRLLADALVPLCEGSEITVVSPDAGGVKRADRLRTLLTRPAGMAFVEKYRARDIVSGGTLVGEVKGTTAIIVDDMISSGTTMVRGAAACRAGGARRVIAAATHGVFSAQATSILADEALDCILVTDSVEPRPSVSGELAKRLITVSVVPLFAEAIRRLHEGGSIVELVEG